MITFQEFCARYRTELLRQIRGGATPRRRELLLQAMVLCQLERDCPDDAEAFRALEALGRRAGPPGAAARELAASFGVASAPPARALVAQPA
jgi:hypothetical protein